MPRTRWFLHVSSETQVVPVQVLVVHQVRQSLRSQMRYGDYACDDDCLLTWSISEYC
jgi:hypothetical protein